MGNITTIYKKSMKMSDMIDADYRLLLLLDRMNASFGFGEKSVDTVCKELGFDTDCFLFLVNLQSNKLIHNVEDEFSKLPLEPFLTYLKNSHHYFLEERLPNIRRKLEILFSTEEKKIKELVLSFFDIYTQEVLEHMQYEDEIAFPYIDALLRNSDKVQYSIAKFEGSHTDIEGKMNDLKQILIKYVPSIPSNRMLMTNILIELGMTEEELEIHTFLEDSLVIPRVKDIERRMKSANK